MSTYNWTFRFINISELVDGVIITISLNNVNQQIVKDSFKNYNPSSNEILGLVANNVKEPLNISRSSGKYYYQYQYNYISKLNIFLSRKQI